MKKYLKASVVLCSLLFTVGAFAYTPSDAEVRTADIIYTKVLKALENKSPSVKAKLIVQLKVLKGRYANNESRQYLIQSVIERLSDESVPAVESFFEEPVVVSPPVVPVPPKPTPTPAPVYVPTPTPAPVVVTPVAPPEATSQGFSCSVSKNVCADMRSCGEAMFYLNSCGLRKLDRDNDGIPCESICR